MEPPFLRQRNLSRFHAHDFLNLEREALNLVQAAGRTLNPKVLAEGSTTATRSPKLPELRERQRTSWSPGKAGGLPPPWRPYGALPRRCKGIGPKPKNFCSRIPGTLLEHPLGVGGPRVPAAKKQSKIDDLGFSGRFKGFLSLPGLPSLQGLPRPCSSQTIPEAPQLGHSQWPQSDDCDNIQKLRHVRGSPLFRANFCWHIPGYPWDPQEPRHLPACARRPLGP